MTPIPYTHKVAYYETDRMGIVHHSNYIRIMEEARMDFLTQIGYPHDRMEAEGVMSPVTAVGGRYRRTTTFADVITVHVSVKALSRAVLTLVYTMTVDGEVVFTGESEHCFLGVGGHILNIKKELADMYATLTELMNPDA